MVKISIICLIYKSTKLCDWVYHSLLKYTPKLASGEAEFFFVANDPTGEVIAHLIQKKYPFIININKKYTEEELFAKGYGIPEYINRVYRGYNQGILYAKGELLVLINSDNYFSPDWLENLLKYFDMRKAVSCTLVEPGRDNKGTVFPCAIKQNFGKSTENFREENFIDFSYKIKKTGIAKGGAYMPSLIYKDAVLYAGLYPEGNIAGSTKEQIVRYGDECFFDRLAAIGVEHITAKDSICYHLDEGEKNEAAVDAVSVSLSGIDISKYKIDEYNKLPVQQYKKHLFYLVPGMNHDNIIKMLITHKFKTKKSFVEYLKIIKRFIFKIPRKFIYMRINPYRFLSGK
jgi:GT2 family glycosyltransferase